MRKDDSNIWLVPSIAWWLIFDTNLSDQKSDPPCQCMQRAAFCSEPPVRRHYRLSFFDAFIESGSRNILGWRFRFALAIAAGFSSRSQSM